MLLSMFNVLSHIMANVSPIYSINQLCPSITNISSNITLQELLSLEECYDHKDILIDMISNGNVNPTTNALQFFQTYLEVANNNYTFVNGIEDEFWPIHIRLIMTFIFSILSIAGIIGNILVITVVFKVPGMITPTNCYLCSLATSDCLFFLCTAPTELSYLHNTNFIFGSVGCALSSYLPFLSINTSSLSIAAFTIERYIGICHPIRARYICTVKRAKHIILGIWIFCILYNSPWLYLASLRRDEYGIECNFSLARDNWTYKVMFLGDFFGFYISPMILYFLIYGKIAYTLSQNRMKQTGKINSHKKKQNISLSKFSNDTKSNDFVCNSRTNGLKANNQVIKMLALVVVVFAVCWLPYRAMVMYNSFSKIKWAPDWYIFFSKTMIFINCAINPILYNHMSKKFRDAFRRLFSSTSYLSCLSINEPKNNLNKEYSTPKYSICYDKINGKIDTYEENSNILLKSLTNSKKCSKVKSIEMVSQNSTPNINLVNLEKIINDDDNNSNKRLISGSSTGTSTCS
ncbi:Thyrotropin-releasing hormone receptor [Strongyloides ratti]|uniref:Thyrotropin-releasing hormone receptor n=1 Tax=Strongyloides ratti TaxID=34506 RepID=A0A090MY23_STRRB|nr:Thyrotropin-releasing hormone receptor [Strongyloides ratti]CEF66434.1 Thyrotropin-releasing hormone receptor [Strongyloides ratti]